jgi:hypothetical protein
MSYLFMCVLAVPARWGPRASWGSLRCKQVGSCQQPNIKGNKNSSTKVMPPLNDIPIGKKFVYGIFGAELYMLTSLHRTIWTFLVAKIKHKFHSIYAP